MSIQQMLMSGRTLVVTIVNDNFDHTSIDPTDAYAGYRLNSDGTIDGTSSTGLDWALDRGPWLVVGLNSDFDVRATLNSGSLNAASSATGSWLVLSTSRLWYCARTTIGVQAANLTIEIRDASSLGVLDTATITLNAGVDP